MTEGEFCPQPLAPGELLTDIEPTASAHTDRTSPLHDIHVAGGASFTDFAGWQMPVSYG